MPKYCCAACFFGKTKNLYYDVKIINNYKYAIHCDFCWSHTEKLIIVEERIKDKKV